MNTFSNQDDVIDSRDVIARIEDLESEQADLVETLAAAKSEYSEAATEKAIADMQAAVEEAAEAVAEWNNGAEGQELKALKALADQCEGYGDWRHGETLIRESYFCDYAMQLADDICAIPDNVAWPLTCIDWEQAARELRMDYAEVDYDGVSYLMRA